MIDLSPRRRGKVSCRCIETRFCSLDPAPRRIDSRDPGALAPGLLRCVAFSLCSTRTRTDPFVPGSRLLLCAVQLSAEPLRFLRPLLASSTPFCRLRMCSLVASALLGTPLPSTLPRDSGEPVDLLAPGRRTALSLRWLITARASLLQGVRRLSLSPKEASRSAVPA